MDRQNQTEKLWAECSEEEKAEVFAIENDYRQLRQDYSTGKITLRQYKYRRTRLIKRLDSIEEKYR